MVATGPTHCDLQLALDRVRRCNHPLIIALLVETEYPITSIAERFRTTPAAVRQLRWRFEKHFRHHIGRPMPRPCPR